jgi:hypothetical protein
MAVCQKVGVDRIEIHSNVVETKVRRDNNLVARPTTKIEEPTAAGQPRLRGRKQLR